VSKKRAFWRLAKLPCLLVEPDFSCGLGVKISGSFECHHKQSIFDSSTQGKLFNPPQPIPEPLSPLACNKQAFLPLPAIAFRAGGTKHQPSQIPYRAFLDRQ